MPGVKVVVLGAAGVGKSSLIRQFVWSEFSEEYAPTEEKRVYRPAVLFNDRVYHIQVVDLPVIPYFPCDSVHEWTDFRRCGLRSASAYVLVFDLHDLHTFQVVKSLRDQICEAGREGAPLVVVGNKHDLMQKQQQQLTRERRGEVAGLVKKHWKCGYVECSARHNWHVVMLFRELVRTLDCAQEGAQKVMSYSSPRFESLHAPHVRRRGAERPSTVTCAIM